MSAKTQIPAQAGSLVRPRPERGPRPLDERRRLRSTKVIVTGCRLPDGIAVDAEAGHIYWTNMGVPKQNDGSIERADLDGRNRTTIVPEGGTFTPKQLHLEKDERQAVLVRPRGDARHARQPRRLAASRRSSRPSRGRRRPARSDEVVRRHRRRSRARPASTGRRRARTTPELGRIFRAGIDMPKGESAAESQRHRSAVRRPARADRPRARSRATASSTGRIAATRRAATP